MKEAGSQEKGGGEEVAQEGGGRETEERRGRRDSGPESREVETHKYGAGAGLEWPGSSVRYCLGYFVIKYLCCCDAAAEGEAKGLYGKAKKKPHTRKEWAI